MFVSMNAPSVNPHETKPMCPQVHGLVLFHVTQLGSMSGLDDFLKIGTMILVGIIGFFVRQLIGEHKKTREDIVTVLTSQAVEQEKYSHLFHSVVELQKSHDHTNGRITDLIERLIRIEAHHSATPVAQRRNG